MFFFLLFYSVVFIYDLIFLFYKNKADLTYAI